MHTASMALSLGRTTYWCGTLSKQKWTLQNSYVEPQRFMGVAMRDEIYNTTHERSISSERFCIYAYGRLQEKKDNIQTISTQHTAWWVKKESHHLFSVIEGGLKQDALYCWGSRHTVQAVSLTIHFRNDIMQSLMLLGSSTYFTP